jgi:hypothetical protein
MKSPAFERTIRLAAAYFDGCKVGYTGTKGYRKSTDLSKFIACIDDLATSGIIRPDRTVFADLGCADGRVNLLMSYFVKLSLGIEIDSEILSEYAARKKELLSILEREAGIFPPENIFLFQGSSLDNRTFEEIRSKAGVAFEDIDIFYTYITLHDVFAEKIAEMGRCGAYYLVYGFNRVLPRYEALELVLPDVGSQGIAALFRKTG